MKLLSPLRRWSAGRGGFKGVATRSLRGTAEAAKLGIASSEAIGAMAFPALRHSVMLGLGSGLAVGAAGFAVWGLAASKGMNGPLAAGFVGGGAVGGAWQANQKRHWFVNNNGEMENQHTLGATGALAINANTRKRLEKAGAFETPMHMMHSGELIHHTTRELAEQTLKHLG